MLDVKFVFILILVLQVKGDCLTEKCEKIHFNVQQHAKQDQELVGHVFHRSVTSNPAQCYLWCINDCQCLSINYKVKNETKYCELNKYSHLNSKNSLKNILGSIYYVLLREYSTKVLNFILSYSILQSIFVAFILIEIKSVYIYVYVYIERVKKNARMDNFWRKKGKKFKNVSVKDLLQLFVTFE